jgi:hypothetical protein
MMPELKTFLSLADGPFYSCRYSPAADLRVSRAKSQRSHISGGGDKQIHLFETASTDFSNGGTFDDYFNFGRYRSGASYSDHVQMCTQYRLSSNEQRCRDWTISIKE